MRLFSEIDTEPSRAELLKFGVVLLVGASLSAGWMWERGHSRAAAWLVSFGGIMLVIAVLPVIGRWAYIGWMTLGVALGRVTSPVVLLVVYALLVVPVSLAFRLMGRDILRRRRDEHASSYWEDYPPAEGVSSYLRQS
ncbi:MAG TPA: SxtJ family membrane protein [Polyangiaceae bacterium]|jgi:hypothetical protein|nr:SxtJ family membrane protein [Polyangiaceae bacterium]